MMLNSSTIAFMRPRIDRRAVLHGCACKKTQQAEHIELSLDTDVLDALQSMGEDWEIHFNTILREWLRSNIAVA